MKNVIKESGLGLLGFEHLYETETKEKTEFEKLLEQYPVEPIKENQIYKGVLLEKTNKYFIVDINNKTDVYIPNNTIEADIIKDNTEIDLYVTKMYNKDGIVLGSAYEVAIEQLYDKLDYLVTDKIELTGTPIELNHAGYTVQTEINEKTFNLFMPHLLTDVNKLPDPNSILNTEISFLVEKIKKDGQTQFIASRKAFLNKFIKEKMKTLYKGDTYTGYIINCTKFGVFVQFEECLTCMIHKSNLSEISKDYFNKNKIEPGMSIEFTIKSIDKKKNQIFGTQLNENSLWDKLNVNDKLSGTIDSIKSFGILIKLDYETKGLIQASNLKNKNYNIGDKINVKVTNINKTNRQITLDYA